MKLEVTGVMLAVVLTTGAAAAQTPTQPPPASQMPPSAPPPPATAAGGAVRIHMTTEKDKGTAHLAIHRPDGSWAPVCASPCTSDVPVNSELRVTYGNADDDPHTFTVGGGLGPEVDLVVQPPSMGPVI